MLHLPDYQMKILETSLPTQLHKDAPLLHSFWSLWRQKFSLTIAIKSPSITKAPVPLWQCDNVVDIYFCIIDYFK